LPLTVPLRGTSTIRPSSSRTAADLPRIAKERGARLVIINRISIIQPLPISYQDKILRIPGVQALTHNNWFGGGGFRHLVVCDGPDVIGMLSVRDIVGAWSSNRAAT